MRMQLLKIVVVLLVAGSGDTRPQNGADSQVKMTERNDAGWRGIQVSSKSHDIVRDDSSGQPNDSHRVLKDLQYMDQSLRTVATQLLNVTNSEDVMNSQDVIKAEHSLATTPKFSEKINGPLIRDVNSESSNSEPVSFGRPINSKFSYFETSHPGQAMAMTEEELEREMSTTRLITAYKNHPTTTGGISTWILLNPPSTTVKSVEIEKTKTQQPFQTEVRLTVRPSSSIEKTETVPLSEKITEKTTPQFTPVMTTEKITAITKKPIATTMKKIATTLRPERVTQDSEKTETSSSTTLKVIRTTTTSTSTTTDGTATLTTVLTTKKSQPLRTTSKPKVTTSKTTSHSKSTTIKPTTTKPTTTKSMTTKPSRSKPTRKTTIKPETVKNETSTGKIEKVTFKPVPIITTTQDKLDNTERPMFVTKIKASVLMDTQKTPSTLLSATSATTPSASTTFKPSLSSADLVEVPVRSKPIGTKGNNVLKVQLKKPVDETTQIEIEPIKVNAPILKIEKVDKNKMDEIVKDMDNLNDSRIDLKFDFNPELTKLNVETRTEAAETTSTSTTASTTTTKRPRHNSKRKKNKTRRRKPNTTSVPSSTTIVPILMESSESVTDSDIMDNAVQESKIAPETKIGANSTKTKKKQPQKAISTQIYNFLSREVMPSFGVMSLVGLGLGLASYFLYPFGGTITRRNYEVEPNYKYNMDEYGGNYGQSEEEMLSKVFQGMTNYDNKYPGTKDNYNNNYYHYQHYDGAYDTQTTKKADGRYPSVSISPVYKTVENTQPAVKYRNTEFRYPEAQTTPVYYDRKSTDLSSGVGASSAANRQFVVGNVPKEYPFDVKAANLDGTKSGSYMSTEVGQTQFERDVAHDFDFPNAAGLHSYSHLGASTIRPDDGYEEIEITPTAVAVEHGPRSLKVKRAALNEAEDNRGRRSRSKRESVIQIIPSKRELEEEREEEEKEEDLSNEILDIIDSALPGGGVPHKTKGSGENEIEDLEGQRRKQQEETNTRAKESILKTIGHTEDMTEIFTTVGKIDDDGTSVSSENSPDKDITNPASPKDPEATTVEWFDSSTTTKPSQGFSLINFVKKVAEIKFRLGLTILKHASEGFARYLGHVQKRINGEE